jgi:hypothetical protein
VIEPETRAPRGPDDLGAAVARDLARDGWSVAEPTSSADTLELRRGDHHLSLRMTEHWAELALDLDPSDPLGRASQTGLAPTGLYFQALCASQRCFLAKYTLETTGELALRAELPAEPLDRADLAWAVGALLTARASPPHVLPSAHAPAAKPKLPDQEPEVVSESVLFSHFKMLNDKGWVYKERLAPNHWRALQIGRERNFDVFLSFSDAWAYFQIPMLIAPRPPSWPPSEADGLLFDYALRMNARMHWAKLGIDEEGQVVLGVEMPLAMFDFRRFRGAARAIEHHAADVFYEVQMLAELDRDEVLRGVLVGQDLRRPGVHVEVERVSHV